MLVRVMYYPDVDDPLFIADDEEFMKNVQLVDFDFLPRVGELYYTSDLFHEVVSVYHDSRDNRKFVKDKSRYWRTTIIVKSPM